MAQITAPASTGNIQSADLIVDMAEKVFHNEPSATPLAKLTTQSKKMIRVVENSEFKFQEQALIARQDQINYGSGYNNSATSIVVDDGTLWAENDLLLHESSGEVMLVTAVSTNTLTVTRGWAGTASSLSDNDYVMRIGNAFTEGDGSGDPRMRKLDVVSNYTQIERHSYGVTRTNQASAHYSGNQLANRRRWTGLEHSVAIETAIVFGKKAIAGAATDNPRRSCDGFINAVSGGGGVVTAVGGTMTETAFNTFLQSLSRYGSSTKVAILSPLLITCLDTYGRNRLQADEGMTSKLGLKVSRYMNSHIDLMVVKHNLLTGTTYGGYGLFVDPANISFVWLKGGQTKVYKDRSSNDYDGIKEEYLSEFSLAVMNAETHGLLTGVTGPA